MKKKTLIVFLTLAMSLTAALALTACDGHQHTFDTDWHGDATYHWHECTDKDCNEIADKAEHTGGTATETEQAVCQVCNMPYGELLAHTHSFTNEKAEDKYLVSAKCGEKAVYYKSCSCGEASTTETFESGSVLDHNMENKYDDEYHWTECNREGCNEKTDYLPHVANGIEAIYTVETPLEGMQVTASDFTVTATCSCGKSFAVTEEGIELEGATALVLGKNTVTVKYDNLSVPVEITAAEFSLTLNGVKIVADTYVSSNGSSAKDIPYYDDDKLVVNSSNYRIYLKYNFNDLLQNPIFTANQSKAKVQFVFALTGEKLTEESILTFGGFIPSQSTAIVDFEEIYWNNVSSDTAEYPALRWSEAETLYEDVADGCFFTYTDTSLTLTFTYEQISKYIDEYNNAMFTLRIKAKNVFIPSMESVDFDIPAVNIILDNSHFHAYIVEETNEYLATAATCTAKATYYKSCSCGEASLLTFEYGEALGHNMVTKYDANNHWTECDREGCNESTEPVAHFGGTATETDQAVCEGCYQPYGATLSHVHSYSEWETKTPATCEEAEVEVRTCACGETETQTGDSALGHNMVTKYDANSHWTECDREGCNESTEPVAHFGGTATETEKAVCEGCNQPYDEQTATPTEKVINGTIVADTYVNSSNKDKDNAGTSVMATKSDSSRVYLRYNLSAIISSADFATTKDTAKVQFSFAVAEGSVTDTTKFTLKVFTPANDVTDVDFSTITWNTTKSDSGKGYAWNSGTAIVDATQGDNITYENGIITITVDYSAIESFVDANGNIMLAFATNTSGLKIASMENTEYAIPTVKYVY